MRDVAIIGVGLTKYGEHWEKSLRDLAMEAGLKAIEDAGISAHDIETIYGGNMSAGRFIEQEHIGPLMADFVGLAEKNIGATRVESACASGGLALRMGFMDVASGMHDMVLVGGVEKMTDVGTSETTNILAGAADQQWEGFVGATFPSLYAMMALRHMHEYGTTREQIAKIAVKNHANAMNNPHAQFHMELTVEKVLNSTMVATPLRLLDCSPISDGAAALILCDAEKAKKLVDTPIKVIGSGQGSDYVALHDRESMTTLKATVAASREAYKRAKKEPKDIGFVEVHDCFTINELIATEDLGFTEKGNGGKFIEEGHTEMGGKIPVNPSGGLKGKGHPVGATGVGQAVEVTLQLRRQAGKRQVDADIGMSHNVGGSGGSALVHIYEVM